MDDTEKYQPPSLASLSMRVVILSNLDERQLVHPLEKRVNAIRSLLAGREGEEGVRWMVEVGVPRRGRK